MKTSLIPFRRSHLSKSSSTGRDPIGMSGFGKMDVCGRKRIPFPPHWMTAFMLSSCVAGARNRHHINVTARPALTAKPE
ncbi:hypothetical protein [Tardiphaga sp. 813_E8_N1_3]|uniref:hypothetical protein n=1 Tax=Tardiphaga sp. 813_E8_N1_3 TaxID=3240760 RepID=UPI003F255FD2